MFQLHQSDSIRLGMLQETLKNIIKSSIDLNNKMRILFLEKSERLHYVFSLKILTTLFRHICVSSSAASSKEHLLTLWRHEVNWLYGYKMINSVDVERHELAFKAVIKKNFSDQNDLHVLGEQKMFSNLRETESGIVITASHYMNAKEQITNGYEQADNINKTRYLIKNSLNEYNKENQKIKFPLYKSTIELICRLCHTLPALSGNCCIMAEGGLSVFIIQLISSLTSYNLISFRTSQFYNKDIFFQQLKYKLMNSYYRAGIRV